MVRPTRTGTASTRVRVHRYLVDAGRPVGVDEIATALGVHHNSIRRHLEHLVEARHAAAETEARHGPGRPRLLYRGITDGQGAYVELTAMLGQALRRGIEPRVVGRDTGRRSARASSPETDPITLVEREATRLGFAPTIDERGNRVDIVLARCPFAAAVIQEPAAICDLHLGIAEGILESQSGIKLVALKVLDPARGGCRIQLRRA
jgi:predicted ArsR family transcriptional regulator